MVFVKHIRSRIDQYPAFAADTLAWLGQQRRRCIPRRRPSSTDGSPDPAIQPTTSGGKQYIKTPALVMDLTEKFRREVLNDDSGDALKHCGTSPRPSWWWAATRTSWSANAAGGENASPAGGPGHGRRSSGGRDRPGPPRPRPEGAAQRGHLPEATAALTVVGGAVVGGWSAWPPHVAARRWLSDMMRTTNNRAAVSGRGRVFLRRLHGRPRFAAGRRGENGCAVCGRCSPRRPDQDGRGDGPAARREFIMGDDQGEDEEKPAHAVRLSPF